MDQYCWVILADTCPGQSGVKDPLTGGQA